MERDIIEKFLKLIQKENQSKEIVISREEARILYFTLNEETKREIETICYGVNVNSRFEHFSLPRNTIKNLNENGYKAPVDIIRAIHEQNRWVPFRKVNEKKIPGISQKMLEKIKEELYNYQIELPEIL